MFLKDQTGYFSRLEYLGSEKVSLTVLISLSLRLNIYGIFRDMVS